MGVRYRLHRDYAWAAGLILVIGCLAYCPVRDFGAYGALLALTCSAYLIANVDVADKPLANVFYTGVCLGLAALVNPWILLLWPCLLFHLASRVQMLNFRTFMAMFLGVALVMVYVAATLLWKNPDIFVDEGIGGFIGVFRTSPVPKSTSHWPWFTPVCFSIFIIRAMGFYHETYPDEKTQTRQFMFLLETLTVGLAAMWLMNLFGWIDFGCNTLILLPASAYATHYFLRMKGPWLKYRRLFWLALFLTSIFI